MTAFISTALYKILRRIRAWAAEGHGPVLVPQWTQPFSVQQPLLRRKQRDKWTLRSPVGMEGRAGVFSRGEGETHCSLL